jgi:hypothetical protein
MKRILIVATMVFSLSLTAQNPQNSIENYWNYHDLIRKAEIAFYLNDNIDSCLQYYNQAFNTFSFNYVHDLVNAAQIACFSKKDYKHFIYKGLHYGLKSSHLKQIPLLKEIISEIEDFEKTSDYYTIRQNYLSGLNFDYLSWIYDLGIEDQMEKIKRDTYLTYTQKYIQELIEKISLNGFPSNRTIGIDDANIFSEIDKPELDLYRRLEKYHDYFSRFNKKENSTLISTDNNSTISFVVTEKPKTEYYYTTDDDLLSNHFIMVLLQHRGCSYSELKDIMLTEIGKGNFHPKELALLYDNERRKMLQIDGWSPVFSNCPNLIIEDGYYKISDLLWQVECSQAKVNALREKYYIVPLEVDKMKKKFEKQYGFKLSWGFWDCL